MKILANDYRIVKEPLQNNKYVTVKSSVKKTATLWKIQLPEKYKKNFDVSSEGPSLNFQPDEGPSLETLYFSGNGIRLPVSQFYSLLPIRLYCQATFILLLTQWVHVTEWRADSYSIGTLIL